MFSGFVFSASHRFTRLPSSVRRRLMAPLRSQTMMFRQPTDWSSFVIAAPAAPAPQIVTRMFSIRLATIFNAFSNAASTTTAVPC